jgi:predicted RNA-binding protein YlxR (DUF448 family)
MACNEQKDKKDLLRIVRSKDGIIEVDLTGKKNGRGAYVCKNEECLNKLIKSKRLDRLFGQEVPNEIYENIRGVISGK